MGTFNIEIFDLLILHRVLWNRGSMKSDKGVTFMIVRQRKCVLPPIYFFVKNILTFDCLEELPERVRKKKFLRLFKNKKLLFFCYFFVYFAVDLVTSGPARIENNMHTHILIILKEHHCKVVM